MPGLRRCAFPALVLLIAAVLIPLREDPLPVPREVPSLLPDLGPSAAGAQLDMDARLLAGLALGEDPDAPVAVMWVARNRAAGRPVLEAVTERQAFGTVLRGRFRPSWSLDPTRRSRHPLYATALARAEVLARGVLSGAIQDPTGGATHFHRRGTWIPPWAPEEDVWTDLGAHAFYRERS